MFLKSNRITNRFHNSAMTTIRRKSTKRIYFDQIGGELAHCSIFDMDNNALILDESVQNGRKYKLYRYGDYYHLECPCLTQDNAQKGISFQLLTSTDFFFNLSRSFCSFLYI